jgi:hypothetical protein
MPTLGKLKSITLLPLEGSSFALATTTGPQAALFKVHTRLRPSSAVNIVPTAALNTLVPLPRNECSVKCPQRLCTLSSRHPSTYGDKSTVREDMSKFHSSESRLSTRSLSDASDITAADLMAFRETPISAHHSSHSHSTAADSDDLFF